MKILIVNHSTVGHNKEYTKKICEYLIEKGNDVTLLKSDKLEVELNDLKNVSLSDEKYDAKHKILYCIKIRKFYKKMYELNKKNNYNVIHHLYLDTQHISILLSLKYIKKIQNAKLFGTIHWSSNFVGDSYKKNRFKNFFINRFEKYFSIFFVHGDRCKKDMISKSKISNKKINTIPYGTEMYKYIDKLECRKKFNIDSNEKVFLFFAGLTSYKGFDILLQALKNIDDKITLFIAGMPYDYMDILSDISIDNIKFIKILRYINNEELQDIFGASDFLLLPYKKIVSGQSGPLTIGATYGVPIIGSDVGEIGSTIEKYNLGYVVKSEDADDLAEKINSACIVDNFKYNEFVRNCEKYTYLNSWEVMCEKIFDCYKKVVNTI